jgi:hypothetical protein
MTINYKHLLAAAAIIRPRLYTTIHHHTPPNAHVTGLGYYSRRRLHGVQELPLFFVLAVTAPSIPLMHQQLSVTITFSGPEMLGVLTAS